MGTSGHSQPAQAECLPQREGGQGQTQDVQLALAEGREMIQKPVLET